jgi:hypothetical protein
MGAAEFERVRQNHEVGNRGLDRQRAQIRLQPYRPLHSGHPPMRHAVGAQEIELRQPELERVESEQVGQLLVEIAQLGFKQVRTKRRGQPCGEAGGCRLH